jgi:hypothetical protein
MDARRDNGHGGADVRGQPQKAAPLDAATAAEAEFAGNLRPRNAPTAQLEQSGVDLGSPFEAMRHHFVLYITRSIGHIVLTGAMVRREDGDGSMVAISVCVDRKAALLRGNDLADQVTMDVAPAAMASDVWQHLVTLLETTRNPARLDPRIKVASNHVQDLVDAVESDITAQRDDLAKAVEEAHALLASVHAQAAKPPGQIQIHPDHSDPTLPFGVGMFDGFQRWINQRSIPYLHRTNAELVAIYAEINAAANAANAEVEALNRAALEAQRPAMIAKYERKKAERAAANAQAEAERLEQVAGRLRTGYWETTTGSYNDRRYSPPWCAKVTGVKPRGELVYEWGDSTARHGSAGLLRVACAPGDIVAWGQKDLRKPGSSAHNLLVMEADGTMREIDRTEAYRLLTAKVESAAS